jgi:uncharacterized repeat protein (TIGR03837 family)
VAWRLASQLAAAHDLAVRIFIDQPAVIAKLAPQTTKSAPQVLPWNSADCAEPAALVLSTFCCRLPHPYLDAMRARDVSPVWINVEYLSAEAWVETHHRLPSIRADGLIEYFFYPGFTVKTGGLLREANAIASMDAQRASCLRNASFEVSVFCYETEAIHALIAGMNRVGDRVTLHIPEGKITAQLGISAPQVLGVVRLQPLPFTDQTGYDALLAHCDFNIVRGEDSFVRAQWAGVPMLWHLYPQAENAHLPKLEAFLDRYFAFPDAIPAAQISALEAISRQLFRAWNGAASYEEITEIWPRWYALRASADQQAKLWRDRLEALPDLATQLLEFAKEKGLQLQ